MNYYEGYMHLRMPTTENIANYVDALLQRTEALRKPWFGRTFIYFFSLGGQIRKIWNEMKPIPSPLYIVARLRER